MNFKSDHMAQKAMGSAARRKTRAALALTFLRPLAFQRFKAAGGGFEMLGMGFNRLF